jgi:hypothetical protein
VCFGRLNSGVRRLEIERLIDSIFCHNISINGFGIGDATGRTSRLCMRKSALPDRLTVMAIAVIAYAGVNITHEIIGHCGTAALLGNKCLVISSTYIPRAPEPLA